jgi:hypothetical protein
MNRNGIDFISKIVKTINGKLSAHFDDAVLGLFDWIDGENKQDEKSKVIEYQLLSKVYAIPTEGLIIQRESFTAKSSEIFFHQYESLPPDSKIKTILEPYRTKIDHGAKRLRLFSERCSGDIFPSFITHGDAGGNFITNGEKNYIVDWDTAILAPPERDAWECMSWDWAMTAFHDALRQNGIGYTLQQNRLAYYCYNSFFFCLNADLDKFEQTGITDGIIEYMDGWVEESFQYADKMP